MTRTARLWGCSSTRFAGVDGKPEPVTGEVCRPGERLVRENEKRKVTKCTVTVTSYFRGNPVFWDDGEWRYLSNADIADPQVNCAHCGRPPTPEGYDACLGYIPGVLSACCGHGVEEPYMVYFDRSKTECVCGRCGKKIFDDSWETCWWCAGPLCVDCWEEYGHCGHPEADEANRKAREVKQP